MEVSVANDGTSAANFAERNAESVQDYDDHDWLSHIDLHSAIMLGDVAIVPVTFGSKDKVHVSVLMRKLNGIWKITKVDNAMDYK
jgi:Protein of unknown function (DUF3828)